MKKQWWTTAMCAWLGGCVGGLPLEGGLQWDEALVAIVKEQPPEKWKEEVELIDQAIAKLSDLREKELSKASWAQNQGDRLQFNSQNLLDARRYWKEAELHEEIAARYQEEIQTLEKRKGELLRRAAAPVAPPPSSLS